MKNPIRAVFDFDRREIPIALLLFTFFFSVILVFQITKPLKKGLFIEHYGADIELYVKLANVAVAAVATAVFSILHSKLSRQRLIYALCGFFVIAFLVLTFTLTNPGAVSIWGFYLLGDLETTLMVAAFWAYATDLSTSGQAKRMFGVVGAGGVIGGWVGATSARLLLSEIGMSGLLILSAVFMVAVGVITGLIERLVQKSPLFRDISAVPRKTKQAATRSLDSALEGARFVFRSPYLASVVGILTCYELASQVIEYQFSRLTEELTGVVTTQAFLANVYFFANCLAVVVQFFIVSLVMKRLGVLAALLVLPIVQLGTSSAFLLAPTLLVASFLVIADNGLNYSIQQTARETLYVVTTPDEKYKARAFTNMLVQRLAKSVGIFMIIGLGIAGLQVRYLSLITVVVMVIMIVFSVYAGRRFADKSPEEEEIRRAA